MKLLIERYLFDKTLTLILFFLFAVSVIASLGLTFRSLNYSMSYMLTIVYLMFGLGILIFGCWAYRELFDAPNIAMFQLGPFATIFLGIIIVYNSHWIAENTLEIAPQIVPTVYGVFTHIFTG